MKYAVRIAETSDAPTKSANPIRWLRLTFGFIERVYEQSRATFYGDLESARAAASCLGVDPYLSIDICEIETGRLYDRIEL